METQTIPKSRISKLRLPKRGLWKNPFKKYTIEEQEENIILIMGETPEQNLFRQEKMWAKKIPEIIKEEINKDNRRLSKKLAEKRIIPYFTYSEKLMFKKWHIFGKIMEKEKDLNKLFSEQKEIRKRILQEKKQETLPEKAKESIDNRNKIIEIAKDMENTIEMITNAINKCIHFSNKQCNRMAKLRKKVLTTKFPEEKKMQETFLKQTLKPHINQYIRTIENTKNIFESRKERMKKLMGIIEYHVLKEKKTVENAEELLKAA